MTPEALIYLVIALLLAVLAGLGLAWARLPHPRAEQEQRQALESLRADLERQERALRQELELNRQQAEARAQGLRTEVVGTLSSLAGNQQQALEGMGQKLDGFGGDMRGQFEAFRRQAEEQAVQVRQEVAQGLRQAGEHLTAALAAHLEGLGQTQQAALDGFKEVQRQRLEAVGQEMAALGQTQRERLEAVRGELEKIAATVEGRLKEMQASNEARLEQMRATVDEKLQSTLEARLGESFRQVNDNLEKVYKSVGEMMAQATGLASGVSGLQRVLTGVKTKGIWGEVQLGALLEQVLAPDMYLKNAEVRPGSGQRVEFAVRFPGADDGEVLLPIDAKFPYEQYDRLVLAGEQADAEGVEAASKAIEVFVKNAAKEISDKYIAPPHSTDFAVMFLPTEGLYAEVLRRPGLAEALQRDYRVVTAGPTTLYAVLNSFQMGFRTLAIQRKSGEVWRILGEVKAEFLKFGESIEKARKKLSEADRQLDKVAVRSRAIDRKLKGVESLPEARALPVLELAGAAEAEPSEIEED